MYTSAEYPGGHCTLVQNVGGGQILGGTLCTTTPVPCSSRQFSVQQASDAMDSPELPNPLTQHPFTPVSRQGSGDTATGSHLMVPSCPSLSSISSPNFSPLHTSTLSYVVHSPSTPETVFPYEEAQQRSTPSPVQTIQGRKPCIVEGCREHIAPSMWRNHMNAHAKGLLQAQYQQAGLKRMACLNASSRAPS